MSWSKLLSARRSGRGQPRSITSEDGSRPRPWVLFTGSLAVILAAFLFGVGLGPDRLPFPPSSSFSDAVTSHWPNALFLRRAVLDDHTWPLWRPLIMGGQPFAANPLNKVWYPPQWAVFLLPPIVHLNLLIWLHLTLAGLGMWAWGRITGLSPWAAALAGLGYALGPRLIVAVSAGHLDMVYAAAWFPWLLWSVERVVSTSSRRSGVGALAGFAAMCFLADVRLSAYALATAATYGLWRAWSVRAHWRRIGARVLAAGLIAGGLTAVQWVPLLLWRADLSRGSLSLADAAQNSLSWGQWIGLVIGDHGGGWESMVYVGVSTLVLAVAALIRRPRQFAFWIGLLVFVVCWAAGDHFVVWTALNRWIPALRWWRVPPRIWFVAALVLPYLAAWGAQMLAAHPSQVRIARLSVVGLLGGGAACGVFSLLTLSSSLKMTAILGTFALPLVALVMLLAIFGRLPAQTLLVLFAVVVAADVLWIDRTFIEGRSRRDWLDPYAELAQALVEDGAVRVYSPSYSLPQQAAAYWEIPQFDGVDPFQLASFVAAFEAASGVTTQGYSVTLPAFEMPGESGDDLSETDILTMANREAALRPDLLGQWMVTHIVSAFPIEAEGLDMLREIEIQGEPVYLYRNRLAAAAQVIWDGPNTVTVTAPAGTTGPLFAAANARWKPAVDASQAGIPGEVSTAGGRWTFEYSRSELGWSAAITGLLGLAGAAVWWSVRRE